MKITIILGHPAKGSFNHAIADTTRKFFEDRGNDIFFHDLYAEHFDPVLQPGEIPEDGIIGADIQKYCAEISVSDGIIIVHPNWWGQPPAILKGWIDRVLRPGVAYQFEEKDSGEGIPIGLLKARCAVVFNTSNTPQEREKNVFEDPLEQLWHNCIFDLCGIKNFYRVTYSVICTSAQNQRQAWLQDVRHTLAKVFFKSMD
jgi:NAD(P)H dehydrogenase (quinone)